MHLHDKILKRDAKQFQLKEEFHQNPNLIPILDKLLKDN